MDVLRLNSTTYLPEELVEGYSSFIWTERYLDEGEFELTTPLISETRSLIPEGSLISLLDSREVMMVETHSITIDENRAATLKVTGRSLETFAENRVIRGLANSAENQWETPTELTSAQIVTLLLSNYMVSNSGQTLAHPDIPLDSRDGIHNLQVTNSSTQSETPAKWWVEVGSLYDVVKDFMSLGGLGVRTIRPLAIGSPLVIDVFNGQELPIVFRYDAGHIDDPTYLFSIKNYKNSAYVRYAAGSFNIGPASYGLERRVLYIDGGDQGEFTFAEYEALLRQKALVELKKNNRAALFDGAISPLAEHNYGVDYNLGDRVILEAQYGFREVMLVAEHVRTEDQAGDQAYPTLILPEIE